MDWYLTIPGSLAALPLATYKGSFLNLDCSPAAAWWAGGESNPGMRNV
jgi:hypothetical protein